MEDEEEYSRAAGDPKRADRWLRRLPLILAALAALPLLWLSIEFSLLIGQIGFYVVALGTDTGTVIGLVLMAIAGFVGLVGTLVCLWIGFRRSGWRWRIGSALATVGCAGLLPLSWVLFGFTGGA
ncbi:hypothetical protein GCM10022261_26210 [Brevibacterium daeguense]|uniref:Major facilitator superfamily (MFS) profile domain-containing protein n=2 Tax=Brevibacterium daeguense TaxID=909936 RepID=A0ABP8EMF8_9MICO|nr:hypothetical protein [Brevibacterium daeguense]